MRVIVIGGGIVGVASAYYLSERGADVVVLERSHLGAGSTGMGGGIRTQFSRPENVRLSVESMAVWGAFEAEFGVDLRRRETGYLFLARTEETADRLRADVAMQNELGVPNELLTPTDATAHCPGLRTEQFLAAAYSPDDLFVDANLALQGFAEAVRSNGVDVRTGTAVTDIRRAEGGDGAVSGVETDAGDLQADFVVNAAGRWAGEVAAMAGVDLPVTPTLRHQLLVEPDGSYPALHPLTMDLDSSFVFYPEDETSMIVSAQLGEQRVVEPDDDSPAIDLDWITAVLDGVVDVADYFGPETQVRNEIAGVYATTPDNNPIIEETVPGFVNAVGFSGHGFMHAPATGQLVSELVLDGAPSLVDSSAFASRRFHDDAETDERSFI